MSPVCYFSIHKPAFFEEHLSCHFWLSSWNECKICSRSFRQPFLHRNPNWFELLDFPHDFIVLFCLIERNKIILYHCSVLSCAVYSRTIENRIIYQFFLHHLVDRSVCFHILPINRFDYISRSIVEQ